MSRSTIEELITVFRTIASIGYLAFSVFVVEISYRGYKKFLKDDEGKIKRYRWVFNTTAILIIFLLVFIYTLLF
ncbi:hypothetical protein A2962_02315 [Candidatus Woesebacteria bacterium RIFCSPLOWO2_01_FULL_39_61]|uniref:Uncharacterized protein n=1 Tax=Candidatus Woesebacteria bacterium RIFCSPHIGHO2_02_FULL_39_13 TaxID=1802505 RepID=A0A1F7Z3I8_9BACT|nr:MAG: hypothetical protein A2692_01330 [Candidatus Woesebacteria bacterium RIFCSPHIGHO2_01_FULL_39_95]OGM33994.1 MAG: hypothetical protein A3D01_03620 [Candidatus Woesebacteria bacterium RIFCSPHIGHO2_02_FULL_39_13]OGM38252.1 MAG: hypothetical protein A3E13_05730 [Candidatus Woesebacteria bacterium RIFCSPHIGHO2_12_FULL_40_20]OGM66958.1 MAG: hypothetical protein A2962_02315 [Candidatus Woesebacteria bacterium RIFCSPLOWO2_01_FULL_39_61]OGM75510.1 MAG: hypothetical protein A3H19_00595 [Candidatus